MRFYLLLATFLLCQACTSQLVIKTIYNDMDGMFADSINDLADFNPEQQDAIERVGDELAAWHRNTQLPLYRAFTVDAKTMLAQPINEAQMEQLATQIESLGDALAERPWPLLMDALKDLNGEQIDQIAASLEKELSKREEETAKKRRNRDPKDPHRETLKDVRKTFKRLLQVKLSDEQLQPFRKGIESSVDLNVDEIRTEREWNTGFVSLLRSQENTPNTQALLEHMLLGTKLLRTHYPMEVAKNRKVALNAMRETFNLLNQKQRERLLKRLQFYIELIDVLQKDR
ncbi:MAG: DUF6279 family lipoprotein [Pseudomonadales bacterium]